VRRVDERLLEFIAAGEGRVWCSERALSDISQAIDQKEREVHIFLRIVVGRQVTAEVAPNLKLCLPESSSDLLQSGIG